MKYYHGTDYESGMNILQNGFQPKTIWSVSDNNLTYLVSEEYDCYEGETPFPNIPAVDFAINASQIAAAHINQMTKDTILFEFDIPDDMTLDKDISVDNMYDCYQISCDTLNEWITTGVIQMTAYLMIGSYTPYLRVFYLKDLYKDYYQNEDDELMNILSKLQHIDAYWFYDNFLGQHESFEIIERK